MIRNETVLTDYYFGCVVIREIPGRLGFKKLPWKSDQWREIYWSVPLLFPWFSITENLHVTIQNLGWRKEDVTFSPVNASFHNLVSSSQQIKLIVDELNMTWDHRSHFWPFLRNTPFIFTSRNTFPSFKCKVWFNRNSYLQVRILLEGHLPRTHNFWRKPSQCSCYFYSDLRWAILW